jgi:hypothetical protein
LTLPNFYLAGSGRCGSTSLDAYLRAHPDIFMSPVKEPNYFSYGYGKVPFAGPGRQQFYESSVKSLDAYRALFRGAGRAPAIGEASINYILHPEACAGIRELTPEAKLVFSLRQPVERAWSSFQRSRLHGLEQEEDFSRAWRDDERRRQAGHWTCIHRYKSLYGQHLRCWFDTFPREQIMVILFEELRANPVATMQKLYAFLGVDPAFRPDTSIVHNQTGEIDNPVFRAFWRRSAGLRASLVPFTPTAWRGRLFRLLARGDRIRKADTPLPGKLKAKFTAELTDDIAAAESLIGRDLSVWYT